MDILDSEASEDEVARREVPLKRLPSHEANADLIEKERRYRSILTEAAASNETIRQKWDEWEDSVTQLTWDGADLEAGVPSSTVTPSSHSKSQSISTRNHARLLPVTDNVQPRILKVASGIERLAELKAEMFEGILDEELAKYDSDRSRKQYC